MASSQPVDWQSRRVSGQTRYAIAKDAEIKYLTLVRFLDENADIRLSTVDALPVIWDSI